MSKLKKIPQFKSEVEERNFWLKNDSAEYLDWNQAKIGRFINLKPTSRLISIRLPNVLLDKLRIRANKMDIPYQSLIKKYLDSSLRSQSFN